MLSLAAAGCSSGPSQDDAKTINAARVDYDRGRYVSVESRVGPLADPQKPTAVPALYLRGLSRVGMARIKAPGRSPEALFDQAKTDLEIALRLAERDEDLETARLTQLALGHVAFYRRHPDSARAVVHYKAVLPANAPEWAGRSELEETLFHLAVSEQRLGDWFGAAKRLRSVVSLFPRGAWEAKARQHLDTDAFSVQAGAFATFQNASDTQAHLRRHGLQAIIDEKRTPSGTRHIVKVGHYRTYNEAGAALADVNAVLRLYSRDADAFIIP